MRKKIFLFINIILLSSLFYIVTSTVYENIYISKLVNNFMDKGVYNEELSSYYTKFYIVPRETWQDDKPSYIKKGSKFYPGYSGDIMVALDSAFPNVPVVNELITFFVGGHAALRAFPYQDNDNNITKYDVIETTGLSEYEDGNVVEYTDGNYWMDINYKTRFIGLRVKATKEQKEAAFKESLSYLGHPYNFTFLFNTKNTKYCSDIMSQAYKSVGIELNNDNGVTTIQDLIISKNTYISIYKYTDKQDISHIYILED